MKRKEIKFDYHPNENQNADKKLKENIFLQNFNKIDFSFDNLFQGDGNSIPCDLDFLNSREFEEIKSEIKMFEEIKKEIEIKTPNSEVIVKVKEVTLKDIPFSVISEINHLIDNPLPKVIPSSNKIPKEDLKNKKVSELKEMIENITFERKIFFHWSWLQYKQDLIDILSDFENIKYTKKKANI
jgi:hypothetical protein